MTSRNRAGDENRHVALCYIRQSYTRDANDTNSPQRQRANIQAVCDRYGWTPEWYVDAEGHKSGFLFSALLFYTNLLSEVVSTIVTHRVQKQKMLQTILVCNIMCPQRAPRPHHAMSLKTC
jgi:hypothetical protein